VNPPRPPGTVAEAGVLLGRALAALAPYRDRIVLAGGLVPFLYRAMPQFRHPGYDPTATKDVDLVLPRKLPQSDAPTVPECLLASRVSRVRVPSLRPGGPDVDYFQDEAHGTDRLAPVHIEFLAPAAADAEPVLVQRDFFAQGLKDRALLFHEPLRIDLATVPWSGVADPLELQVARPFAYVLQKVRARKHRAPGKRDSDLAAIYDVALLSQPTWQEERASAARLRDVGGRWPGTVDNGFRDLEQLAGDASAVAGAVRVAGATGVPLTERQLSRVLVAFCEAMRLR